MNNKNKMPPNEGNEGFKKKPDETPADSARDLSEIDPDETGEIDLDDIKRSIQERERTLEELANLTYEDIDYSSLNIELDDKNKSDLEPGVYEERKKGTGEVKDEYINYYDLEIRKYNNLIVYANRLRENSDEVLRRMDSGQITSVVPVSVQQGRYIDEPDEYKELLLPFELDIAIKKLRKAFGFARNPGEKRAVIEAYAKFLQDAANSLRNSKSTRKEKMAEKKMDEELDETTEMLR